MGVVGTLLWVLVVCWLLHLAVPSATMRRSHTVDATYYAVWIFLLGSALWVHYTVLAHQHHARLALMTDGVAFLLYGLGNFGIRYLRLHWRASEESTEDAALQAWRNGYE